MKIKDLNLPLVVSTNNGNEPYTSVIIPLLKEAKFYERGVAYFHCEWVGLAKDGLVEFIKNGGKMKLLTSIDIKESEMEAFIRGEQAKINPILKRELIDKIKIDCRNNDTEWMLNFLSWMVCIEALEIRVSVNTNNIYNIYHDKIAILSDEEDSVCIHGSLNDSMHALRNQESVDIFVSWIEREKQRINEHRKLFDKEWEGEFNDYIVIKLPDFIKLEFAKLKDSYNPYNCFSSVKENIGIRDYQFEAVKALEMSSWHGILSMATGSGKTLTSLFAVDRYLKIYNKAIVCIVVPQLHLLFQWVNIVRERYNTKNIIICAELKEKWGSNLFRVLRSFSNNSDKLYFIFTTYKTLIDDTFQNAFERYKGNIIFIFDECHKLGSSVIIKKLKLKKDALTIGLSATPNRWLDDKGNSFLKKVIGETVFEFALKEAINRKYLTEYEYHIFLVELTIKENIKFMELTSQIKKKAITDDDNTNESLKKLFNERARIVKKAEKKFDLFFEVFSKHEKKYSIIYVFDEQVEMMVEEIKKKFGLITYGIVASTKIEDRNKILKAFNNGEIDVIVAIQCLDEGIDVPNCKYAYLLASSTNPREFIQRRGRILRLSNLKGYGVIYDFVCIAPDNVMIEVQNKLNVIKRELPRVAEFTRLAKNKNPDYKLIDYLASIDSLYIYAEHNPWEINKEVNDLEEEENE